MLKALLTDKSLLNYQSQTTEQTSESHHRSKASTATQRPLSWHHEHQHLRRNGELTFSCATTDANVKPVSNGELLRMNGHAGKVLPGGNVMSGQQVYGLRQHSSDVVNTPSGNDVVNHIQSQSDSVTRSSRSYVANEC